MKRFELRLRPGALLFWALVFFLLPEGQAAALLLPCAVHELGHLLCLKLLGLGVSSLNLELCGLRMDYSGSCGALGHAAAAAAGPLAGIVFYFLLRQLCGEKAALMAGVSLLLSLFNLLPIYPLDGGRLWRAALCAFLGEERGGRLQRLTGDVCCGALTAAGLYLMLAGCGAGLFAAGLMTALLSRREG